MAKNRRRNRRRLERPYVKWTWLDYPGYTAPPRDSEQYARRIEIQSARRAGRTMALMNNSLMRETMERYGITMDDLQSGEWRAHFERGRFIGFSTPNGISPVNADDATLLMQAQTRPIVSGTVQDYQPLPIDPNFHYSWQSHLVGAVNIRIYNRGEFDEEATNTVARNSLERMLADHQQRLRMVRAVGGDEESALELNFRELRILLDTPEVFDNNELFYNVASAAIKARTAWFSFKDSLKALSSAPRDTIPCSCGHRQHLDPASDDYAAGLAFCDACGAGYTLEFEGDKVTGWLAFSAE